MSCQKYYFDLDYYGVSFYEEEVTTEHQQGRADNYTEEIMCIMEDLRHLNAVVDHNYNREQRNHTHGNPNELGQGNQERSAFRKPTGCCRKQFKFTPKQLLELNRVFQETQYPDALKRKELAELINVDECAVKVWFNNRRVKHKKEQRALLRKINLLNKQNRFSLKILKETKNVIVLQEPLRNKLLSCRPPDGHPN